MAEHHEQISEAGKKVERLRGEKESPQKLKERAAEIVATALDGANKLKNSKISSSAAKEFLASSTPKVTQYLQQIAEKGYAIIQQKKDKKEAGDEHYQSIDSLHKSLKTALLHQKESIGLFSEIEKCQQEYEKLVSNLSPDNADKTSGAMRKLLEKMPISAGITKTFRDEVFKNISDIIPQLNQYVLHKYRIDALAKNVKTLKPLAAAYEKDPTPQNLQAYRDKVKAMDLPKIDEEIFGNTLVLKDINAKAHPLQSAYRAMESTFKEVEFQLAEFDRKVEQKEKEDVTASAEKMLSDVEANQKSQLTPLYEKYSELSRMTTIPKEDERKAFLATEEGLLNGYLVLQMTVASFNTPNAQSKLEAKIGGKVKKMADDIAGKIKQIEVNRQTRKGRESLSKTDIFTYVDLIGEEKDGKIYKLNAAYDALPEAKKTDVRMAVENIFAQDKAIVKQETTDANLRLLKSSGNFEKMTEVLGERSKKYVEGLKLLMEGKNDSALAAFKTFIADSVSFTKDDLGANNDALSTALNDAKEKIIFMNGATEYFEALDAMEKGDKDAAAERLKAYLDKMQGKPEVEKIHAEQISNAKNLLRLYGHEKVQQLDELLGDVREWKKAEITERADFGGKKREVRIEGPEVELMEEGIRGLRERVEKGEILDFRVEFNNLQVKVKSYLEKNAINPQDNIIDKFSELYEGLHNQDPQKKRETLLAFAQELRGQKSYDLARRYLDKLLQSEYREAAKNLDPSRMRQMMLNNPKIMQGVREQAQIYFEKLKKENPSADIEALRSHAEQMFFNTFFKKQYNRELRKIMTDNGMAQTNKALELYNDWSPYKTAEHFWESGNFDAETYDAFKREATEFAAMTIATLPLGGLGGAAAKGGQALLARGLSQLLLRGAGKTAIGETAILALERGGIWALQPGSKAFMALEPAVQNFIVQHQVRLGLAGGAAFVGGLGIEAGISMVTGNISEGIIMGQADEMDWSDFRESFLKTFVFKGIGLGGNKLFGLDKAREKGERAARYLGKIVGMEAFSGGMGMGIEAGTLYWQGKGSQVDTKFILQNILQNAVQAGGSHIGHGIIKIAMPEGPGSKADRELRKAYVKEKIEAANKGFGVDFSRPETITSARVDSDGQFIINGKKVRGFDTGALEYLSPTARERIWELSPNTSLDTHYRSRFGTNADVPRELWQDPNDPNTARDVHGWIDTEGNIHYNLNHLNEGYLPEGGGPYRATEAKKIMPEGYSAVVASDDIVIKGPKGQKVTIKKGDLMVQGPDGPMSYKNFVKSPEGKLLHQELVRIKNHESTHQALEFAFTKKEIGADGRPRYVEDPTKTKALMNMFATPGNDGSVPEGKTLLVLPKGKPPKLTPVELTWENVQEYLCHVGDGSIPASKDRLKEFETVINKVLPKANDKTPDFSFQKARNISTKFLAINPQEAFTREKVAALDGEAETSGPDSLQPKSVADIEAALAAPESRRGAQSLFQDLVTLANHPENLAKVLARYPHIPKGRLVILTSNVREAYAAQYATISRKLMEARRNKREQYAEMDLNPLQREILKAIIEENKDTSKLLSSKKPDGTSKSSAEIKADLVLLEKQIASGKKGMGESHLQTLLSSEAGQQVVAKLIKEPKVTATVLASEKGLSFVRDQIRNGNIESYKNLPVEIKEALKKDTIETFKEKLFEVANDAQRTELLKKFTDEEIGNWLTNLENNPVFGAKEDLPAVIDILMANQDKLDADYLVKILRAQVEYKTVQVYESGIIKNKQIIIIEGAKLGQGGLGIAYKNLLIDSRSPQAVETVMKKPLTDLELKHLRGYNRLDESTKIKVREVVERYSGDDLININNFNKAEKELRGLLGIKTGGQNDVIEIFYRRRAAALEARNNKLVMKYQSLGKLKGFVRPQYVSGDGRLLIMESITDQKTGEARSLKSVIEGKVDVDPNVFWDSLATAVETIHELHELGIIHHDLKPDNIAIGADGKARILDFGSMMTQPELQNNTFGWDDLKEKVDISHIGEMPQDKDQVRVLEDFFGTKGYGVSPFYYDYRLGWYEGKGLVPLGSTDMGMIARMLHYDIFGNADIPKKYVPPEKAAQLQPLVDQFAARQIDAPTFAAAIRNIMLTP